MFEENNISVDNQLFCDTIQSYEMYHVHEKFYFNITNIKQSYFLKLVFDPKGVNKTFGVAFKLKNRDEVVDYLIAIKSILISDFQICDCCMGFGAIEKLNKFLGGADIKTGYTSTCSSCQGFGIKKCI